MTRHRVDYPELKKLVRQKAEQFRPDHIIIENKASGIQLIQEHLSLEPVINANGS